MAINPILAAGSVLAYPLLTTVAGADLPTGDAVSSLIGNVGFPIAVTIYVLYRLEAKMTNLSDKISELVDMHRSGRDLIKP